MPATRLHPARAGFKYSCHIQLAVQLVLRIWRDALFRTGWHVSAGYIFNENSIPDSHYTPLVTDLDKHFFSIGAGFKGKRFDFDLAYQFGYGPTHTVSGSAPSLAGQTADGKYEFISHAIEASVGWHF